MNNPEGEVFSEVSAVLRFSVAVLGEGDKQIQLGDPNEASLDPTAANLMMAA
jgi:hypothetical protein